jgi:hypothetical protein
MNGRASIPPQVARLERGGLIAGGIGLAAGAAGFFSAPGDFFPAYLLGFVFCAALAMGSLALLLLHQMFGARWGFAIQRPLEAATRTLPLLAVMFIPIALGIPKIYSWAGAAAGGEHLPHGKAAYLNTPFFLGRTALYFAAWILLAWLLGRWSQELDRTGDPRLAQRLRNSSAPGLLIYGLTATFAVVDWLMSLDPHWFSTVFGLIGIAGQVLAAIALMSVVVARMSEQAPYAGRIGKQQFHDLGNLLFAFTMVWAYLSFSQYLIIWSGNLPETIPWYQHRSHGGWQGVAVFLAVFHFAVPFLVLLSRQAKRGARALAAIAGLLFVMRLVEFHWVIVPTFHPGGFHFHWLQVALPAGLTGMWLWFFARQLRARPLLPERDPRMIEAFEHAEAH